ncbi:MAG TPA: hypothetical protein VGL93_02745 [Streptosporangiaceae bacterium]
MVRRLALSLAAVVVLAGAYVGYASIRHVMPRELPAPTGRYAVGRVMADWTDTGRVDPLAPRPGVRRELSVWLWYPAARTRGRAAAYAPGAWAGMHIAGLPGLGETSFAAVRAHAHDGARVAAGRFPVVVLEPGLGQAAPLYTTIAENLASHGYLVAGVTPTYSANLTVLHGRPVTRTPAGDPPDSELANPRRAAALEGRLVSVWAADARFAAARVTALGRTGRFAGHVDTARTAYAGHSLGGAASLEACRTDRRCAGAADLDGDRSGPVARRGLRHPMLLLGSENSCVIGVCRPASAQDRSARSTAAAMVAASTGPVWRRAIAGTQHFNFSDFAAFSWAAPVRALMPLGPIDGARGLRITNGYVTAFADHVLRGATAAPLGSPVAR